MVGRIIHCDIVGNRGWCLVLRSQLPIKVESKSTAIDPKGDFLVEGAAFHQNLGCSL